MPATSKGKISKFTMEKMEKYHFNEAIKASPVLRYKKSIRLLIWITENSTSSFPGVLARNVQAWFNHKKHLTSQNWGKFYKITSQSSSKMPRSWRGGETRPRRCLRRRLEICDKSRQRVALGGTWSRNQVKFEEICRLAVSASFPFRDCINDHILRSMLKTQDEKYLGTPCPTFITS